MTIKKCRDVAAILSVLRDSFRSSVMHNGVIDSFILMDKPIAQPGALGNAQSKGHGEHSCLRCPLLRPDPAQRQRLLDVRENLLARIDEARREGWLGEVEGLQISLAGARTKLAQVEQMTSTGPRQPVQLGIPTRTRP